MPRPLKNILRLFCVVLLCIFIVGILAFKTPLIFEKVGPLVLNAWLPYRYPGCRLKIVRLTIDKKIYRFPEDLIFNDFDLVFKQGGDEYRVGFSRAELNGVTVFLGENKIMRINVEGVDIQAPQGHLSGAALQFLYNETIVDYTRGILTGAVLRIGGYGISDIKSRIFVYPGQIVFEPFSATLYGGSVRGKITVDYRYAADYRLRVKFENVDLKQLEPANPAFFSQVRGILAGKVAVDGVGNKIRSLSSSLSIDREGSIKAVLLRPFVSYIPPCKARAMIETLIERGEYVPFSDGELRLERVNSRSLRAVVNLRTPVLHLQNTDVLVNLDAALGEGLRDFLQSIPGEGGKL